MNPSKFRFPALVAGALSLLPLIAHAHGGIGQIEGLATGLGHPLGGADHLLAMVAVGLWAVQMGGSAVWLVPSSFVGTMVLGGAMGVLGIQIPFIEPGILASVMVLGLLIAAAIRFPALLSLSLVGLFALFHGHAHGAGMPLASAAIGYSLGLALSTAILHGLGILLGSAFRRLSASDLTRLTGGAIALSGAYLALA
ncbi:MAG: HupE/UreJ family protein [Gammaproteobacteria bacterium]|nr:HupE/UreJ family protein [Gammaproteobacteria bacterium]MBU1655588.1 HupE/UreJ family protein [Gammaproteobacteria bacterium]MBU1961869.1 HupE/UreJ family protein [Gammaproteobacteria bacterium]